MRWLVGLALIVAMFAFGAGVYQAAEHLKGGRAVVEKPSQVSVQPLPGTLYFVQQGAIYRLQHGNFTQITSENGWLQPAADPRDNDLVAVQRRPNYSELYLISTTGRTLEQLTHNSSAGPVETNHWSFYPRFSPDGSRLYYSYDPKDPYNTYRVDLAIFAARPDRAASSGVQYTTPNAYTGGDVNPLPLRDGGLVYVKYSIDDQLEVHSQIWLQRRAASDGVALTEAGLDCAQPALSTDQKMIAMVCRKGSNSGADLDLASFDGPGGSIGAPITLATGLVASPTFSPDGKLVAYFAPGLAGGAFQLWTVATAGSHEVRQITSDLGLDSDSPAAWVQG